MFEDFMSVEDLAKYVGVGLSTVRTWIEKGDLPSRKQGCHHWIHKSHTEKVKDYVERKKGHKLFWIEGDSK